VFNKAQVKLEAKTNKRSEDEVMWRCGDDDDDNNINKKNPIFYELYFCEGFL